MASLYWHDILFHYADQQAVQGVHGPLDPSGDVFGFDTVLPLLTSLFQSVSEASRQRCCDAVDVVINDIGVDSWLLTTEEVCRHAFTG